MSNDCVLSDIFIAFCILLRFILFVCFYLGYVQLSNCPLLWKSIAHKANFHLMHLL